MQLEGARSSITIADLWKEALGGETRWNALPDTALPLHHPYVQVAAMAHWVAEHVDERDTDRKMTFDAFKKDWSVDAADSPSARFRSYQESHRDETCNPHDEAQVTALLQHVLDQTLH
ncbi:hypothetical protein HY413_02390 [Candidatus Kaiserbacteria bacterium]|nr:hypothetical protein [Candidatus Kaiserbacteria bacterium]